MGDLRLRTLERQARVSGNLESLKRYVSECVRNNVYPSHDLGVAFMQETLNAAKEDYTIIRIPGRYGLNIKDIEYLTIPYDLLLEWIEIARSLDVVLMTRRIQGYVGAGNPKTQISSYLLSMKHYDDFMFNTYVDAPTDEREIITYSYESEYLGHNRDSCELCRDGFASSHTIQGGFAWPHYPRDFVTPYLDTRRFWESSSGISNLQFLQVETDFTYRDILKRALEAPEG